MPRRNPSSQAADIGLRASGDRLGRMQIFDGRIGECNSERPAEHATSDKALVPQTTKEKARMNETFHTRPREVRPRTNAIPYTKDALERDLERVHAAWDDCQTDRRRDAIYGYLKAVHDLVRWWSAEGAEVDRARRALRSRGLLPWPSEDVFAAIIRCTADPARADKRTRSKWSQSLALRKNGERRQRAAR